jgi:hypothetical protein
MDMKTKILGVSLAGAVALTFVGLSHASDSNTVRKWVKCYGINSCRGKSTCMITTNSCKVLNKCKGQNSCRGKGFLFKHPEDCKRLGGSTPELPGGAN